MSSSTAAVNAINQFLLHRLPRHTLDLAQEEEEEEKEEEEGDDWWSGRKRRCVHLYESGGQWESRPKKKVRRMVAEEPLDTEWKEVTFPGFPPGWFISKEGTVRQGERKEKRYRNKKGLVYVLPEGMGFNPICAMVGWQFDGWAELGITAFPFGLDHVYTLKLEGDKYYVGTTKYVMCRLITHDTGFGVDWTKKYLLSSVMDVQVGGRREECERTLEMMELYGWENVRGDKWCKVNMQQPPEELLLRAEAKERK